MRRPARLYPLLLLSGVLAACSGKAPPPPAPTPVIAATAGSSTPAGAGAEQPLRYPVEVLARYSNTLSFRVSGKLIERTVRLGDRVHKGQVVARLDPLDATKQAQSAQAARAAAEHRLAYARQQLDRDEAQAKRDLIAANQLEQSQDNFASAQAAFDQAEAQLVVARNTLDYNTLTADHDGLITSENADTGQVVTAGQAIYGLAWSGDTDAVLDVAASDIGLMRVGQEAQVRFPALPGQTFAAQVREIAPAADPQSRTYRIKLSIASPGERVRFGMTGDATLARAADTGADARAAGMRLPATALFHQGAGAAVWVIRPADSTLELRPVTVTSYGSGSVTVGAGLKPEDTVVLAGVHTVFAGQHVKAVAPLFASDEPRAESAR